MNTLTTHTTATVRPTPADADQDILANACLVELPPEWSEFLAVRGATPFAPSDARQFRRAHCRGYAMVRAASAHWAVMTCDVSCNGLSFLHHDQLYPGDLVQLFLPGWPPINLQLARCTKRGHRCFVCGARAVADDDRQTLTGLVRACASANCR